MAAILVLCGCQSESRGEPTDDKAMSVLILLHSLQLTRDACTVMFPMKSSDLLETYNSSDVPNFARTLEYERDFSDSFTSREMVMNSFNYSETEASDYCFDEFTSELDSFNKEYGGQSKSYLRHMEDMAVRIEKQKTAAKEN